MTSALNNQREYYPWVNNLKLFACILVVLGHLLPSFVMAGIFNKSAVIASFVDIVYTFHVNLFFLCSGFLYQVTNKVHNFKSYKQNVLSKLVNLGIPYFVFSIATLLIKIVFNDSVNVKFNDNVLKTLFVTPYAPYWYLYVLFLLFLVIPCMDSKRQATLLFIASFALKILYILNNDIFHIHLPYIILSISNRLIWFALGILLVYLKLNNKTAKWATIVISLLGGAIGGLFILNTPNISNLVDFLTGMSFVIGFTLLFKSVSIEPIDNICKKCTPLFMPIFVMHTIFAAGVRIVLCKLGIFNPTVHLLLGLFASFILPAIYYLIAKRIPLLMLLIYPKKAIEQMKNKRIKE